MTWFSLFHHALVFQITYSVKKHIKHYIVNHLQLFIYLQGKRILEPHQIIVRTWQPHLNTQKETITMLSMENFFVLATLLVFIFRVIVPLLLSDWQNKNFQKKFAKTWVLKFYSFFIFIHFLCIYSFWRGCKYNFKVWEALTQLYHNARNFLRHKWNLNNS